MKCGCSIYFFFLISANLICPGTDISKYFRESLDYEITSRLYFERGGRVYKLCTLTGADILVYNVHVRPIVIVQDLPCKEKITKN